MEVLSANSIVGQPGALPSKPAPGRIPTKPLPLLVTKAFADTLDKYLPVKSLLFIRKLGAPPKRPGPVLLIDAKAFVVARALSKLPPVAAVAAGEELVAERLMLLFTLLVGVVVDGVDVAEPARLAANMAAATAVPLQAGKIVKGVAVALE